MYMQTAIHAPSTVRPALFIPAKPQDFENGVFPAVVPNHLSVQEVLGITMPADTTLTAKIEAGTPFFGAIQLVAYNLTLETVDPEDLPLGHKGVVYHWVYTQTGRSNGLTPLPVKAGQKVIVTVDALVDNHELTNGATFVGQVGLHGVNFAKYVLLTGTYRDQ